MNSPSSTTDIASNNIRFKIVFKHYSPLCWQERTFWFWLRFWYRHDFVVSKPRSTPWQFACATCLNTRYGQFSTRMRHITLLHGRRIIFSTSSKKNHSYHTEQDTGNSHHFLLYKFGYALQLLGSSYAIRMPITSKNINLYNTHSDNHLHTPSLHHFSVCNPPKPCHVTLCAMTHYYPSVPQCVSLQSLSKQTSNQDVEQC